ncbi:MAG: 5-(carboxyamino)imidazole ribonucleotide synthase [Sphingomonas bacterium]|uniref:5-(carboxyamino)imidazole ribonucleotide synthase n=1 Tax=Sphingomonas bacterium TaxID=1895847 RepID=UPI002620ECB5|nr:5-(carboxyamino)imidazole ribonucleotide synthase [Sphingomonas bacterium]MDB5695290.1 5-(carboxyamino)imidazole ribonucleotide synthase [Sphingomonas bacterium]
MIPPGSTIGILGGGQLGRMLGLAAAQLGYRVHVFAPEASGPATEVAAEWTQARFEDGDAMRAFAARVDVATYEFENVDPHAVSYLAGRIAVHPSARSLDVSRYRPHEKALVAELGGRTADWAPVDGLDALHAAVRQIGTPAILKTTLFGYDGKGQARIDTPGDAASAWEAIGRPPRPPAGHAAILEARVNFAAEFSVLLARGTDGATAVWAVPENVHVDGVLATSAVPASALVREQAAEAIALAKRIAEALGHVGVLACEFFATADGPVFNEMAPRVHNSGHWTIEGAVTSQFENHIRAVCGLPLGLTALTGAGATMENLLGEQADRWPALLAEDGAHLHLYGKTMREGRKMGHVTRVLR